MDKGMLLCAGCPYAHPLPWHGCCGRSLAAGGLLGCAVGVFAGALRARAGQSCWHSAVNRMGTQKRSFEPLQLPGAQPQGPPRQHRGSRGPRFPPLQWVLTACRKRLCIRPAAGPELYIKQSCGEPQGWRECSVGFRGKKRKREGKKKPVDTQ